jgi:membrane-bound metal-dependent hydrolase YbcI (DUF457 family)
VASYRGHLTFSTLLGSAYGGIAAWKCGVPAPMAGAGGLLTAVSGLLPDLDSDSGVPVRELFGLAGAFLPLFLLREANLAGLTPEQMLLAFAGLYFGIRYGLAEIFRHLTVHRGMFHSIPAMLIVGLLVFIGYRHPEPMQRLYLAVGAMLGFLSHLVLDEICAVNLRGVVPRLNAFAGSALKLRSKSRYATGFTYVVLLGLCGLAWAQHRNEIGAGSTTSAYRNPPVASIPSQR